MDRNCVCSDTLNGYHMHARIAASSIRTEPMQIVFNEDGAIEFTRKPKLLNVVDFGRKIITRMTDIIHNTDLQRYVILFLKGPHKDKFVCLNLPGSDLFYSEYGGWPVEWVTHSTRDGLISFNTYEDAVEAEVRFVEFLRDTGHSMI